VPRFVNRMILIAAGASLSLMADASLRSGQADAQIMRRPPQRRTANWIGASIGITQGFGVLDGSTGATWDFGSGLDYAVRIERPTGSGGLAVGLQASFARLPLTYSSSTFSGDAKADISQLMGVVRYGGGYGFHGLYELQAGVIGFSDFRSESMPTVNLSSGSDYDPKLSLGYGFGFGLSSTSAIEIVQELGIILHQREGLSGSQSNYPRVYVTRIGGKIAF
jgi:hypothetical protein